MPENAQPQQNPLRRLKEALFGKPIPTKKAAHEKLSPTVGLAVFASDALSSVAYATEAILGVLILISLSQHPDPLGMQFGISMAVVGLIAVITFSYRQTIRAYPQGGGSYIVASSNLGPKMGLVAGAALLIDYTLTVAVSIAAGIAAVVSAFPSLHPYMVPLAMLFVALIGWANLRGMRESGALFAIPTYGFVLCMAVMVGMGIYRSVTGGDPGPQVVTPAPDNHFMHHALLFMVLRAFAAGCTALTGIEAVSDGVQAFRPPEQKNAAMTLVRMAIILSILFLGMGYIAMHMPAISLHPTKSPEYRTLASQVAAYAFGGTNSVGFFLVQGFTAAILLLAANTAFADFPRVCSFLARDGFLPRYMSRQGDRLVFHNGIILLIVAAMALIFAFHGELDQLLPLYAVGVFTAFSLSQAGMVKHWWENRELGWKQSLGINALGLTLCVGVLLIILVTKFEEGAWLITILMPALYFLMLGIKNRYRSVSEQLQIRPTDRVAVATSHKVLLLVPRVHRGLLPALEYVQTLKGEASAVHVTLNEKTLPDLQRQWANLGADVPLVVLPSPFRSLTEPVIEYVDELRRIEPDAMVTVIVAEPLSTKWYQRLLSENVAQQLKQSLGRRPNVIVANVRYLLN